jgi:hypothetical protein
VLSIYQLGYYLRFVWVRTRLEKEIPDFGASKSIKPVVDFIYKFYRLIVNTIFLDVNLFCE